MVRKNFNFTYSNRKTFIVLFLDNPNLDPGSFLKENIVEKCADEFMFMGCIKFINEVRNFFVGFFNLNIFIFDLGKDGTVFRTFEPTFQYQRRAVMVQSQYRFDENV